MNARTRLGLLGLAMTLTVTGGVTAATRSTLGSSALTMPSPHRSLSDTPSGDDLDTTSTTDTTDVPAATTPSTSAKPKSSTPTTAAHPAANSATGTILEPAEEGVYVLDVTNGNLRKADGRSRFDVLGQNLYLAHGNTVTKTPIEGGPTTPVMTVAGASDLGWIEVSPNGSLLTEWATPTAGGWNLWRALVDPTGKVLNNDLGGNTVEWAPDGSYFVVFDYRGVRAVSADNTALWGPVPVPAGEYLPYNDVEFTPDDKHVLAVFSQAIYSLDLATKAWTKVPGWQSVSMEADGRYATSAPQPAGWDGRTPIGTVVSDLSGTAITKLTGTGSEPVIAPTGDFALYTDEPLVRIGDRGPYTFRLVTRAGNVLYTISKPGWELGRDTMRGSFPQGFAFEGPQWSADGRYVVFGVYNPYTRPPG